MIVKNLTFQEKPETSVASRYSYSTQGTDYVKLAKSKIYKTLFYFICC